MGFFKSKDRNMYIAFGVVVVVLVAVIVWMYTSRDKGMSLDGEAEAVRQELQRISSQPLPTPSAKESYVPPTPSQKPALVVFHAEFCGHCKNFMPVWQELKSKIPQDKVTLLDFQMEKEPEIVQQNNVKGFPDIRLYPQGFPSQNYVPYQGNRQPDSLMRFVMSGGQSS